MFPVDHPSLTAEADSMEMIPMKRSDSSNSIDLPPKMSELRAVVLGGSWAERSLVGKLIVGEDVFMTDKEEGSFSRVKVQQKQTVLINTPDLLHTNIPDFVEFSYPGPHVLLLLLKPEDFTHQHNQKLRSILGLYRDQAFQHLLLLISSPKQKGSSLIQQYKQHPIMGDLIMKCQHTLSWHKNLDRTELLKHINHILEGNKEHHLSCHLGEPVDVTGDQTVVAERDDSSKQPEATGWVAGISSVAANFLGPFMYWPSRRAVESPSNEVPALRIVLLGGTDHKRVRLSNLLTGYQDVNPSNKPIKECVATSGEWRGKPLTVVKTPDVFSLPQQFVRNEMKKCTNLCFPGPNALLLLVKPSKLSSENKQKLSFTLTLFGQNSFTYSMVVITQNERETMPVSDLTKECGGRLYNMSKSDRTQLLGMIEEMVRGNQDTFLTYSEEHTVSKPAIQKPPLSLVLFGRSEEEKTAAANAILDQSHTSSVSEPSECFKYQGEVCGRKVSLVYLPALNGKSRETAMRESLQCISLCDPEGVHAFLLVLSVGPPSDGDKRESQIIQNIFGSEGRDITMPLFTTKLDTRSKSVVNFLETDDIRELCQSYGGNKFVLNINDKQQISELLEKVIEMRTKCKSRSYTTTRFAHAQIGTIIMKEREIEQISRTNVVSCDESPECLRIVLIGKTGSGKSSSGNTILGRQQFKADLSPSSVTTCCQKAKSEVDGRSIEVVDTPGLFDTTFTEDEVIQELLKCVSLLSPGPHVILLVLQIGSRFTKEELDTLKLIKRVFGVNSEKFTIVLFTNGDALERQCTSLNDYIGRCNAYCRKLIADCGERYHVFNNLDTNNHKQVTELIAMTDTMVKSNGGSCYTTEMFQEAEEAITKEMGKILKEKEEEMQRMKEELERKHEDAMTNMKQALDKTTAEVKLERREKEKQLAEMERKIEKERKEREKETEQREEEQRKLRVKDDHQREEYQKKLDDLEEKIRTEREEKQTVDRELERSRVELKKQQKAWEKKQEEWWDKQIEADKEAWNKEREKLKQLQAEYNQERDKYEMKRREEDRIRKEKEEQMRKDLEDSYRKKVEEMKKKYEEEARKQAEEFNDFRLKYTKDFTALMEEHMEELKIMKRKHERDLEDLEHSKDKKYTALSDLSSDKDKQYKLEVEDLRRKHEQDLKDLKEKYQKSCTIL